MIPPKGMRQVGIVLDDQVVKQVHRIAKKRKIPIVDVYRMMIDLGIDCHKDMEQVGIIKAVDFAHFVKKSVKKRLADEAVMNLI